MHRPTLTSLLAASGASLLLGACTSPQYGAPCPVPEQGTVAEKKAALGRCLGQIGSQTIDTRLKKDVDILFLIDNSPSMSPKQKALADAIPKFISIIDATGANYHVGIATSDIGSTVRPGELWGGGIGKCDEFEGDDGVLQQLPCTARSGSAEARNACVQLCPNDKFVPTDGKRYISKVDGLTNVPKDLRPDPTNPMKMLDFGPINAFKCMALVGDTGCGLEGQLEGSKRALDNHRPENSGFLRPGSVLAVIYITDEDDCSVAMNKRVENNPVTQDCSSPDQNASYECYNIDYRCLARSVQCDQPLNTPGSKTGCKERPNNYLDPTEKYYKFFSSLRTSEKLLISGIWTLPSSDSPTGKLTISRGAGGASSPYLNRAPGIDAACFYGTNPALYGQAQLRLSKFARQFGKDTDAQPNALEISICDIDNYDKALEKIAKAISKKTAATCLPVAPKLQEGQPACLVGYVDESNPESTPDEYFPQCSATCCDAWATSKEPTVTDPNIVTACTAERADCFCAAKSKVGLCADTAVAGIWRKGNATPPAGRVVNFRCVGGGS